MSFKEDSPDAVTLVVLSVIIRNHNKAILEIGITPEQKAKINQQTIDAIRDNAHNINPRSTK